jgi:hypothetical protein
MIPVMLTLTILAQLALDRISRRSDAAPLGTLHIAGR